MQNWKAEEQGFGARLPLTKCKLKAQSKNETFLREFLQNANWKLKSKAFLRDALQKWKLIDSKSIHTFRGASFENDTPTGNLASDLVNASKIHGTYMARFAPAATALPSLLFDQPHAPNYGKTMKNVAIRPIPTSHPHAVLSLHIFSVWHLCAGLPVATLPNIES